ncbi:MAG: hypothetical protein ACKVT2_20430 [Saprospiraceae bacterium]
MKKYFIAFLVISLSIYACQHEGTSPASNCVEQFIIDNNLIPYDGQDLDCNTYVSLFELDGKEYFYTDNPCADMLSIPVDCEGVPYCSSVSSPELEYFLGNAVDKGIVGIKP